MALTYYLKIDGIAGDSTSKGHEGWFELSSFAFGDSNSGSASDPTAVSAVNFQDLMVALTHNTALVALLARSVGGTFIPSLRIEGVTDGSAGASRTVYQLTLNNVLVSSVNGSDSAGGVSTTTVAFNYGQIGLVTTSQNPDGSLGAQRSFGWDLVTKSAIDPATLIAPTNTSTAAVPDPVTYYVKIDGIAGDSTSEGHEGWFELPAFSLGETNSGSVSAGGGAGAGKVNFQDLSLTLAGNTALAALLARNADGKHITALEIEGVTGGADGGRTVYDLTLNNVLVSSVSEGAASGGGAPITNVTFNFGKIGIVTTSQNLDGSLGAQQAFGWDLIANTAIDPATLVVPSNTTTAAAAVPVTYYVRIDGVAGDSTSKGYEGWFELSSFSLGQSNSGSVSAGGGAGVGKVNFQDLSLALASNTALAALLASGAAGKVIQAVEIEGVSGGAAGRTVYDLTINNVRVSSVSEGDFSGSVGITQVSFNFGQIGIVTTSQNPDGSLGVQQAFGWDVVANAPLDPATLIAPSSTAVAAAPDPVTYYLRIDGIAGTSTNKGHEGWFELSAFSFGESHSGSLGGAGGAGAGKVNFQDLSVILADNTALAALLARGADGKPIIAIEIEGVVAGNSGAEQTVYDLTLNDVLVSSVSGGEASGDSIASTQVSFNYGRIGLVTTSQGADGGPGAQQAFGWDLVRNAAIDPASLAVPTNTRTAAVPDPVTYFVRIDGVAGDSTSKGHEGWFELSAFSFGESNSGSVSGGGVGVGKVNFQDLSLTLEGNTALAALLARNADGKHLAALEIEGVTAGGRTVYDLTLNNVLVSSVSEGASGGGGGPFTNVSFNFGKIGLVTTSQNSDGSPGAQQAFGWDLVANTAIDPATLIVPNSSIAAPAGDPVTYYLKIDGIVGGATSKGHEGWFELPAFSLGQSNSGSVSVGGAAGVGKVNFNDLSVVLSDNAALTALLARSADGKLIAAIEIEGVTGGAEGAGQTVYDLTLNNVLVSSVFEGASDGVPTMQVSFNFGLIGLVTTSQNPDGSLGAQSAFGWNIAAGTPLNPATLVVPDIAAPLVAIASQLLDHDTGPSPAGETSTDRITSDGQVTLTGTASDDATLASVHIFDGAIDLGAATLAGTTWTFSTLLTPGTHALRAVATDAAGKSTTTATQPEIIVDATGPTVAVASQLLTNDTGVSSTDRVTSDGRVTLSGTASDGIGLASVRIFDGATDLGNATLSGTNWSFGATLAVGTHALRAVATDIAGNVTTTAAQPEITVIAIDPIVGQPGQVTVTGTAGSDTIIFGTSNLFINAGGGDDSIAFAAGSTFGVHRVNGGAGTDTLDLSALTTGAQVNLATALAVGAQVGLTSLSSIENVIGGQANDTITANNVVNWFTGGAGADTFAFATLDAVRNGSSFRSTARDTITDFHAASQVGAGLNDVINLRGIDAIQGGRDNAFVLNATPWDGVGDAFTAAGQLRYRFVIDANGQEHTIIMGNVHSAGQGNGLAADFEIDLIGHHEISASDFIF